MIRQKQVLKELFPELQSISKLKGNVSVPLMKCFVGGVLLCLLSPRGGSSVVGCLQQMSNGPSGSSH